MANELDRVPRRTPDGTLYVTAGQAAGPGAAALTGFDGASAVPPMAAASVQDGLEELNAALASLSPEDALAQTNRVGAAVLELGAIPLDGDWFGLEDGVGLEEYEFVAATRVPLEVGLPTFGTRIAVPLGADAAACRANLLAAVNGTAVPTVPPIEVNGGGFDAPVVGTANFRGIEGPAGTGTLLFQVADAPGGNPVVNVIGNFWARSGGMAGPNGLLPGPGPLHLVTYLAPALAGDVAAAVAAGSPTFLSCHFEPTTDGAPGAMKFAAQVVDGGGAPYASGTVVMHVKLYSVAAGVTTDATEVPVWTATAGSVTYTGDLREVSTDGFGFIEGTLTGLTPGASYFTVCEVIGTAPLGPAGLPGTVGTKTRSVANPAGA